VQGHCGSTGAGVVLSRGMAVTRGEGRVVIRGGRGTGLEPDL
jgi:pantoate kinase